MAEENPSVSPYTMRISRLIVDKLGVKLYDRVSLVLAELVANSYDADATEVKIKAPMGRFLATKGEDGLQDAGYCLEVEDNGIGMTPEEVQAFYLIVGAERRRDDRRGDRSRRFKRKVMGRKGVGKLAPFGICQKIEVLTSGGKRTVGIDEAGNEVEGYLTAHLIMDREEILSDDTEFEYEPEVGELDGIIRPKSGTLVRLSLFAQRKVPELDTLERQLSQRFGIVAPNWQIQLIDTLDTENTRLVGQFEIDKLENTEIRFENDGRALGPDRNRLEDLEAGFDYEGRFYSVTGWVAYSQKPYKDDLMAGVRIYCRGKIASKTNIFALGAGFTGEYDIRSYLIGELHADWLDEDEDLIQTDRKDILWSHEVGTAFQGWGQNVVRKMGKLARSPVKKKSWDVFRETTNVEERIEQAFPKNEQAPIRKTALDLAKRMGSTMRREEIEDEEQRETMVGLSLMLAPHVTLDDKLKEASEESPLSVIVEVLKTARISELASFGRIADERIRVIDQVETLIDDTETAEAALQNLITEAPWLINPEWSPLISNQRLSTLRKRFEKYYERKTGQEIELSEFTDPNKRPDFVLTTQDNQIQIIEIKPPNHFLNNDDMDRLNTYIQQMEQFLADPTNKEFAGSFQDDFKVTLICDGQNLDGLALAAYGGLLASRVLTHINWDVFLKRTKSVHEEFLEEAARRRNITE